MICPECSQTTPYGVATCPHCGHDLRSTGHGEGEIFNVAAPAKAASASKPWIYGLGVGLLVLIVGGLSFSLLRNTTPGSAFADRIPGNAIAYVEIDIAQLISSDSKAVIEEFGGLIELATDEEFDIDVSVDDLISQLDLDLGPDLSYSDDIASWASGSIAVGVLESEDPFGQRVVVWVSGRNEVALSSFLDKMKALAAKSGIETASVTISGIEFFGDTLGVEGLVGQVGTDLLIVTDTDVAKEVLDLQTEESLQAVAGFTDRIGRLQRNAIVTFATTGVAATQGLAFNPGSSAPEMPELPDTGWIVGSFGIDGGNIRFEGVTGVDPNNPAASSEESAALGELPADVVLFTRLNGISYGISSLVDLYGADLGGEVESATGVSLEAILGLFESDAAFAVWPSSQPEIPVGAAFVGVGEQDAAPVVDQLNQSLIQASGWNATMISGGYWYEDLVAFGARGPLTIVTTDRGLLAESPSENLLASEIYKRAADLLGGEFAPIFAADIDGVVDLIDGFIDDDAVQGAFACNPVRFISGGFKVDGDLWTTVAVIEIEAPAGCN